MYESNDDNDNDSEFYLYSDKWESSAEGETTSVAPEIARFNFTTFIFAMQAFSSNNSDLISEWKIPKCTDLEIFPRTTHFPTWLKSAKRTSFLTYVEVH